MRGGLIGGLRHGAAVAAAGAVIAACGGGDGATAAPPDSGAAAEQGAENAEPSTDPRSAPAAPSMESTSEPAEPGTEPASGAGTDTGEPAGESTGGEGTDAQAEAGTYRDYGPDLVADPAYDTTVLFFHASWCPECRAFDESIRSGTIPDGVQILKVDYDSETELKQRYGVTLQSTFVTVDPDGAMISSWVGYGKDRSIDTILTELE